MKLFISLLFVFALCSVGLAQVPQGINYQAIVRDGSGQPITTGTVDIRISLLNGSGNFVEDHLNITPSTFGLVNLVIGSENTTQFAAFDWTISPTTIEIFVNTVSMGSAQPLQSVPYALHCATADALTTPVANIDGANGLNRVGNEIRLGGKLGEDVEIIQNGQNVSFTDGKFFEVKAEELQLFNNSDEQVFTFSMASNRILFGTAANNAELTYVDGNEDDKRVLTSDKFGNATWQDLPANSQLWTQSGSAIYYSTGNVGIGEVPSGTDRLQVTGTTRLSGDLNIDSGTPTLRFRDASSVQQAFIQYTSNLNINTSTTTADIAIGGNNLYVDKSTNRVGIGTTTPSSSLQIQTSNNYPFTVTMTSNGLYTSSNGYNRIRLENGTSTEHWLLSSHAQIGTETTNNANLNVFYSGLGNIVSFRGNGSVGIGVDVPTTGTRLQVQNDASTGYVARFYNYNTDVASDGIVVGVGGAVPSTGAYYILFTHNGGAGLPSGSIRANGSGGISYNQTSDSRLKQNIVDLDNALSVVKKIKPRSYEFKANSSFTSDGFIAQEMLEVYPNIVSGDPDGDVNTDPMMIDYSKLTPLLTKAIQEQQVLIDQNQKQIQLLQEELSALKRQ